MPSNKTWGQIFSVVGMLTVLPTALVAGTVSVLNGRPFDEGADEILDPIGELGTQFGEKHGQTIEKVIVEVVVWTVLQGIVDVGIDEIKHHPPKGPGA